LCIVANTKISAGRRLALIGCYDDQKPSALVAGKPKPMKDRPTVRYKAPTEEHAREVGEKLAELLGTSLGINKDFQPNEFLTLRVSGVASRTLIVDLRPDPPKGWKITTSLPKFWRRVYRWYGVDIVEAMQAKMAEDLSKPSAGDLLALLVKAAEDLPNDSQLIHAPAIVAAQLWLQKESAKPEAKPDGAERAKNWGGLMPGDRVDVTAKSGLIVRTVIRTVGVKSSDHLPVFVTNEDGEGHDWLDTRLFTITRVEEQKELTKA